MAIDKFRLEKTHPALPQLADDMTAGKLDRREFLRTSTMLGLSAAAAYGAAGMPGVGLSGRAHAQGGASTIRCSMNVMEIANPALLDWSQKGNLCRQVIEPLVKIGADNTARPYLAESWSASEDLKTWTLNLRQGVTWSNGDAFTASDVAANMDYWRTEANGSSNFGRFSSVEGAEAVDDNTVVFHLSSADLSVPAGLGDYPAMMVHPSLFDGDAAFNDNAIGTGPYALEDYAVGQRAAFRKREGWWGGDATFDEVVFIDHGDDMSASLAALASGQVDLLYEITADQVPAVRGMDGVTLFETVTAQTGVARMRVTEAPFDDVRVRQAVQACIDHAILLEIAYQNLGRPGEDHHVCPIHPEYAELPAMAQDYERARALLADAGYPNGLDIQIDCVAQPTWEPNTCQVIAEMLRPAGINLSVNIMPGGTYWDRWLVAPFGFTSWTHRPLGIQVLNLAYRSGVAWNETGYANPEFDSLLDQANGTIDVDARRQIMAQLQTMLQSDAIMIQPYWRAIHTAGSSRLQGFELQPAREFNFTNVSLA